VLAALGSEAIIGTVVGLPSVESSSVLVRPDGTEQFTSFQHNPKTGALEKFTHEEPKPTAVVPAGEFTYYRGGTYGPETIQQARYQFTLMHRPGANQQ
jgi:hypothetical protein